MCNDIYSNNTCITGLRADPLNHGHVRRLDPNLDGDHGYQKFAEGLGCGIVCKQFHQLFLNSIR